MRAAGDAAGAVIGGTRLGIAGLVERATGTEGGADNAGIGLSRRECLGERVEDGNEKQQEAEDRHERPVPVDAEEETCPVSCGHASHFISPY